MKKERVDISGTPIFTNKVFYLVTLSYNIIYHIKFC